MQEEPVPESLKTKVLGHSINAIAAGTGLLASGWVRRRTLRGRPVDLLRLRWLGAGAAVMIGGMGLLRDLAPGRATLPGTLRLAAVALVGLILGNLTGRALGLQRRLDTWGRSFARPGGKLDATVDGRQGDFSLGVFMALNPLLIPATIHEGLGGRWTGLALKAVLDAAALAAWAAAHHAGPAGRSLPLGRIARVFGPVMLWQATWATGTWATGPWLVRHGLSGPLMLAGDLLILCSAPAVAGFRGTPQANLLPTLLWIPILGRWLAGG